MHRVQQRQPLNNMCEWFEEAARGCLFDCYFVFLEKQNERNYKILE